jgi:hypothetical protein
VNKIWTQVPPPTSSHAYQLDCLTRLDLIQEIKYLIYMAIESYSQISSLIPKFDWSSGWTIKLIEGFWSTPKNEWKAQINYLIWVEIDGDWRDGARRTSEWKWSSIDGICEWLDKINLGLLMFWSRRA